MKVLPLASGFSLLLLVSGSLWADSYSQVNLVSNLPGTAAFTDPNLIDPWGVSFSATSPIWVSDRGAGVSTLYSGTGTISSLVVTVPPGTATSGPTGQVFAGPTTTFMLAGKPASFIFDTLGGSIAAWNGGTSATIVATVPGAQYEGLAMANNTLYAANFTSGGGIDVFNSSYALQSSAGKFVDPSVPAGYAPFNIQNINGKLYVEYAKLTPGVPVALPGGGGYVDVFDTSGNLLQRLISNGPLNAPWGVALAPSTFGSFSNDLLVGNFGNGEINAFDPNTGTWLGALDNASGNPFAQPGLWAIAFGNSSANSNGLYFTAGIDNGNAGLFGVITDTPEPNSFALAILGFLGLVYFISRKRRLYEET